MISSYRRLGGYVSNVIYEESGRRGNIRSQEISIVLASDLAGKVLGSKVVLVALASLLGKVISALLEELEGVGLVDALALGGGDAVADPLPELASGDLGGGSILPVNQIVSKSVMRGVGLVGCERRT